MWPADRRGETHRLPAAAIAGAGAVQEIFRQQLTADVNQRLRAVRALVGEGRPEAALAALRLAQTVVRSAPALDEDTRTALDRRIQAAIMATVKDEERISLERAERLRLEAAAGQRVRGLEAGQREQERVAALMIQFDSLMTQGESGHHTDARRLAQSARALAPGHPAPRAGSRSRSRWACWRRPWHRSRSKNTVTCSHYRMSTARLCPSPTRRRSSTPIRSTGEWCPSSRIARYGHATDLLEPDPKTRSILAKLEQPVTMSFANETPLEEVLKYIRAMTQGPNDNGMPIYVDPVGLNEAGKTMVSPVTLDLEGVPLKTTLRLLLKQLGLTYTVKAGLLTITAESSDNQPTEIRVYPVADLTIIPLSIMGASGGLGRGGLGGGGLGNGMGSAGFRSTSPFLGSRFPF